MYDFVCACFYMSMNTCNFGSSVCAVNNNVPIVKSKQT